MEKRVVLLVVLCIVIFMGWSLLMRAIYQQPPAAPAGTGEKKQPDPKPADPPRPPPTLEARHEGAPAPDVTLDNGKVRFVLTNRGAGILEATAYVQDQKPMPLLASFDKDIPHLAVMAEGVEDDTARGYWKVMDRKPDEPVTYLFPLRNGVDIEKKFTLKPGRNELDMVLTLRNNRPETPVTVRLRMIALTGLEHDSPYRYDYYGHGVVTTESGGAHATMPVAYDAPTPRPRHKDDKNPPSYFTFEVPAAERETRHVEWIGLRNRYAAAVLLSKDRPTKDRPAWISRVDFRKTTQKWEGGPKELKSLAVEAELRPSEFKKDESHIGEFALILAPIRREDLESIPGGADYFLSYGCWGVFNPIGRLILWLVGVSYQVAGNFGWAIIMTTIVVRLALFPLTRKSQVSMFRMSELQPKLNALRERYPDDAAKQQQETMKLFKENGVNPLSGCFPIMLQLPIFIGLYSVLDISLEFRHAPFIGWITDLSQPDRLIPFAQPVDLLLGTIEGLNLVPIVMTVTWFLQAYYAPRPQDPRMAQQQRIMMFMPIVFGLLCYSLASGLSLYLFVNSLLAMIEQKVIKKYFLPAKAPSVKGASS